jgi:DNA repair protein RecO (recombination protein O)
LKILERFSESFIHAHMTFKTKGIILRTIKYGETSLVVTMFTELFGIQTYMVNGVRSAKRSGNKAAMYQPAAILELEVYHNEMKSMQRIKEANWGHLYDRVFSDVIKNSVALYMVELLHKTLKQPEKNEDLYYFCEDALIELDKAANDVSANFPLYYSLHLMQFFGFRIADLPRSLEGSEEIYLDLREGSFSANQPSHTNFLQGKSAAITAELLRIMQPSELSQLKLNKQIRRELLLSYLDYYALHIQDFGTMKTIKVLHEILS